MKLLYKKTTPKIPSLTLNKKVHCRGDQVKNKIYGICKLVDFYYIRGRLYVEGQLENRQKTFISGPIQDWEAR